MKNLSKNYKEKEKVQVTDTVSPKTTDPISPIPPIIPTNS
jgi:hypothetical protein